MAEGPQPQWNADPWLRRAVVGVLVIMVFLAGIAGTRLVLRDATARTSALQGSRIEFSQLIRKVKAELVKSENDAIRRNELSLFALKDFELEIKVVASGSSTTGVKLYTVGSDVTVGEEMVQTIRLRWVVDPERRLLELQRRARTGAVDVDIPPD